MTVIERYFLYMQQLNEGTRPLPPGFLLTQTQELAKAGELQQQVMEVM